MGICFECCVTIDGAAHQRSCTMLVRDGMEVVTGG
jgi:predicted molibdopterin-dependent oxidoreductase YjgC